jgi:hypothetical protein
MNASMPGFIFVTHSPMQSLGEVRQQPKIAFSASLLFGSSLYICGVFAVLDDRFWPRKSLAAASSSSLGMYSLILQISKSYH